MLGALVPVPGPALLVVGPEAGAPLGSEVPLADPVVSQRDGAETEQPVANDMSAMESAKVSGVEMRAGNVAGAAIVR